MKSLQRGNNNILWEIKHKQQLYYFLRTTLPNTEHKEIARAKDSDSIHSNIMSSQLALKTMMKNAIIC